MKNTLFILLFISSFISLTAFSTPNMLGERLRFNSDILNESREVQVWLPENYHSNQETTYPVIYLLDGDYLFNSAAGVLDLLANKGQLVPDVILVGISDKGTDKYRQYMTPKGFTAPLKVEDKGRATEFLSYINNELKPYINKNYRTADNNILYGHSIAGLFVLNSLLESPKSFNHYLASSPSLWLNDHAFAKKAAKMLKVSHDPVALYLSLGDETRMGQYRLIDVLDDLQPKHIKWHFQQYPDENHNSVSMISFRNSIKKIFDGWFIAERELNQIKSPDSLLTHYENLLESLNIDQPIPTPSIRAAIRYFYLNKKDEQIPLFMSQVKEKLPASEQAFIMMLASYSGHFSSPEAQLNILLENQTRFTDSIEFIKAIAVAYEKLNDKQNAHSYYEKALALAKRQQLNQWQVNIVEAKVLKTKS